MRPSLPLAALLALALLPAGCGGCFTKTEAHVDVPTTIEEVKKLHSPPGVDVRVERKERKGGSGGGCGHSALCVIVVPFLLYDALFPEKWDQVTVTEAGKVTYEGRFETGGKLIEATARKDGVARHVGVLALAKLGKRVIVEVARAPVGPDGKDGAFTRSPILPQVDLAADYRKKLADEKDADDRAALLVEYGSWLTDEALPLLEELLPAEGDDSAALTLSGLCKGAGDQRWGKGCTMALGKLEKSPGPKTAAAGFGVALTSPADAALAPSYGKALVTHACDGTSRVARDAVQALTGTGLPYGADPAPVRPALAPAVAACAKPGRRVLLQLSLAMPTDPRELRAALADEDVAKPILERLSPVRPEHRAAILDAMPAAVDDRAFVEALTRSMSPPDAPEVTALADSYVRKGKAHGESADEAILKRLADPKVEEPLRQSARRQIEPALSAAAEPERPRLHVALTVLGARDHALPASRGLDGLPYYPDYVSIARDVIAHGLVLAGCKPGEVLEAARNTQAVKDSDRGVLCTR